MSLPTSDDTLLVDAVRDAPYGDACPKRIEKAIDAKVLADVASTRAGTDPLTSC